MYGFRFTHHLGRFLYGPIGTSKTKNQKAFLLFDTVFYQSVKKMKSKNKTRFRRRKRRLENQKTCSFFDVEKQGSKSKNELHGISL